MLGVDADPAIGPDKKLIPLEAWGLKIMSIGFMVDEGAPMIWRGPMASSARHARCCTTSPGAARPSRSTCWCVDLPPGTGDIQLTLVQKVRLSGAVIVSTPQEIALIDARRAAAMFAQDRRADPRRGREHGLLRRPRHRRADPDLRPRRRARRGRAPGRAVARRGAASTSPCARRRRGRPLRRGAGERPAAAFREAARTLWASLASPAYG